MAQQISLEELVKTGAHFGHQTKRWNPKMKEYIYSEQKGVHVLDLIKTKTLLEDALKHIESTIKSGKTLLLLGTKKQVKDKLAQTGKEAGVFYVNERWLGGTLTNFDQIKRSCRKLTDMRKKMASGEYNKYTKKERLLLDREIKRLERFFGGIEDMAKIPDLLFVIDIKREKSAIHEAKETGIPVIAIVDTNSDPDSIDFPIPMNDDAKKALDYVLDLLRDTILNAKKGGSAIASDNSQPKKTIKTKPNKKEKVKK